MMITELNQPNNVDDRVIYETLIECGGKNIYIYIYISLSLSLSESHY